MAMVMMVRELMKAATQGMVRTKLWSTKVFKNIENQLLISFLPARKFKLSKWEGFAELVLDDEGEAKTEDEVGEGEVEDENVSGSSHLFLSQDCRQNKTVTQD